MTNTAPSFRRVGGDRDEAHKAIGADGLSPTGIPTLSSTDAPQDLLVASLPSFPDLDDSLPSLEEFIATFGEEAFLNDIATTQLPINHDNQTSPYYLLNCREDTSFNDSLVDPLAPSPMLQYLLLTPTSSQQSHTSSSSIMSNFFSYEAERALEGSEEEARQLFFANSSAATYNPTAAPVTTQPMLSYPATESYSHQPQWQALPLYSQQPSTYTTAPPSTFFPAIEAPTVTSGTSAGLLTADPSQSQPNSGSSRSGSPNPADLHNYGFPKNDGTWRCAYPGCSSRAVFTRGCDLRKHFNRHSKHLFCRHEGCPQSTEGGFSSKKDRARHEAKHNPGVLCEWEGCGRIFSRVDNMKDHVRRIHRKASLSS